MSLFKHHNEKCEVDIFANFPYSNEHEMNGDWLLRQIKDEKKRDYLAEKIEAFSWELEYAANQFLNGQTIRIINGGYFGVDGIGSAYSGGVF